jgi:hypothetical protein
MQFPTAISLKAEDRSERFFGGFQVGGCGIGRLTGDIGMPHLGMFDGFVKVLNAGLDVRIGFFGLSRFSVGFGGCGMFANAGCIPFFAALGGGDGMLGGFGFVVFCQSVGR